MNAYIVLKNQVGFMHSSIICGFFVLQFLLCVRMERFVWLVEMPQQEELNCVSTTPGVQCVMTSGILRMLELSADNLDFHSEVSHCNNPGV